MPYLPPAPLTLCSLGKEKERKKKTRINWAATSSLVNEGTRMRMRMREIGFPIFQGYVLF